MESRDSGVRRFRATALGAGVIVLTAGAIMTRTQEA